MADGRHTFSFSAQTQKLINEQGDFFRTLLPVLQEAKLKPKKGEDARSERRILEDGRIEITFQYPLDNNDLAEDGRIYLKDRFFFDPFHRHTVNFERDFELKGRGAEAIWAPLLEKLKAGKYFNLENSQDAETIKSFAYQLVLPAYSHPITPSLQGVFQNESLGRYFATIHDVAVAQNPKWKMRLSDPETRYSLVEKEDGGLDLVFSVAIDDDKDPANGRVVVHDKFMMNKDHVLQEVQRKWSVGRASRGTPGLKEVVVKLNGSPPPAIESAQVFLEALPQLLNPPEATEAPQMELPPKPMDLWSVASQRAKRRKRSAEPTVAREKENLEILQQVASEQNRQVQEGRRGWWQRWTSQEAPPDSKEESARLAAIFQKASASLKPGQDAWHALAEVELPDSKTHELRRRLLNDAFLHRVSQAASELNPEMRAAQLLGLARDELVKEKEFIASARFIAQKFAKAPEAAKSAEQLLAFLDGSGSVGTKVDFLLPMLPRHLFLDSHMIGVLAAMPLGVGFEAVGLATAGKLGRFGQWLASGFGIFGEAVAFTAAHKTIQALARDPDTVFTGADDFLSEAGSAALLFGPFRMVHWVGAEASAKMVRAQSKLGKSLFVRKGPAEVDAILERTAAGRIRLPWNHAEIGTPLSQLNWLGRGVSSLINHGGGVAAIYGGAALGRWLHWQPANDQALGGNLFDAVVGYGQLFLGTRFLDGFTQGALFEAMGEARIRLRSRSRSANAGGTGRSNLATTTGSHRVPTILRLVGGEGGPLEVHVPPGLKTIRLGRDSSDRESHVSYPAAEEATVHVKGEGVVENHAQFKESESGVWYLGDLGSAAGTVVNGEPLQAGMPHMLRRGDRLRLGEGPEYLLEPIGRFIEPEHPRNPGITFPLADHPPPEVAAEFPYTVLFPGEAFPADRKAGVAVLKSARDGSELIFEGNQTDWRMPDRADGTVPMLQWCIDERGRFFVSKVGAENPAAPNEIILNGIPIPRWAFVRNNDEISIDAHPYQFMVFSRPRTKRPTSNPPRNGPYLLEAYPPEFLAALEPNEPPMILHSPSIQAHTFRADPQHTSFILGSDPQSDPSKPWQTTVRISGANVEDSHAEIAFGTDGSFHILDRGTKQGTYITRGGQPAQRAGIGKWLSLAEDDLVYLGKPGEAGSAEIDFGKRKVIDSGRRKTMTDGLGPMPAAEFPRHLFRHLQPGQPVATLTMGQETIEWGQDKTNMSFGKSVPDEGMGENSGRFSLTDLLVSELHVSFFITTKGEFYVKDLMSKNGTYVNGGERLAPQTPTKLEGEAKIGLGAANGEMGSTLITFRRRAEPRDGGDEPPLAAPPPAAPSPAVPPPPPMSSSPRMVGPPERTNRVDRLPEPSEISFPGPRPAAPTLESATLSAAAASAPSAPSSSSASSAAGASSYEAGSVDEAFADLNDSEITAVGAEAVPEVPEPAPAAASATAAPAPPPASAADANLPVVPSGTAVTTIRSVDDMAIDSALNALSPDSGLASLVGQLHPYLLEAHPDFSASLAGLNLFPRLDSTTRRGVTVETLDDLHRHLRGVKEQTEHRPEIASSEILSDAILGRFKGKSDRKFPLDLYLSSDGKRLQLSSFTTQTTEPLPDAAIALHLNPRAEGNALVAALRYFASIRVPTQVVLPFSVPSNEPAYMGVFFKTEDTSAIYPTVLAMINKTREAGLLGDQYLPFSHRLLDAQNMEIPGVGVLEYHPDSSRDPLGERKYLIVRAYTDYAKQRKAQTPESPFNSRELLIKALRNLTTEGFDLQQPGFRKPESLPSPYAELLDHSLFPPVDPAVVEAFKKSK